MDRRGFLGRLAALVAAPLVALRHQCEFTLQHRDKFAYVCRCGKERTLAEQWESDNAKWFDKLYLATALALVLMASPALAQQGTVELIGTAYQRYELDATTLTYGKLVEHRECRGAVETSGSSTTVSADDPDSNPFATAAAGNVVVFYTSPPTVRRITSVAGAPDAVVVDTALNLTSPTRCELRTQLTGTGAEAGWIDVSRWHGVSAWIDLAQYVGDGNGVNYQIECRGLLEGSSATIVFPETTPPQNETAVFQAWVGIGTNYFSPHECRVAFAHDTADDGDDATTNAEILNVSFTGRR